MRLLAFAAVEDIQVSYLLYRLSLRIFLGCCLRHQLFARFQDKVGSQFLALVEVGVVHHYLVL